MLILLQIQQECSIIATQTGQAFVKMLQMFSDSDAVLEEKNM